MTPAGKLWPGDPRVPFATGPDVTVVLTEAQPTRESLGGRQGRKLAAAVRSISARVPRDRRRTWPFTAATGVLPTLSRASPQRLAGTRES